MKNKPQRGCQFCDRHCNCNDAFTERAKFCRNYEQGIKRAELRKYAVCLDCGKDFMLTYIPAKDEKTARKYCEGQGEIISIKDITENNLYNISLFNINEALEKSGMVNRAKRELVVRALSLTGITD